MKAISIYTITEIRIRNTFKSWNDSFGAGCVSENTGMELDSMKALVSELERHIQAVYALRFSIPFRFRDWERV